MIQLSKRIALILLAVILLDSVALNCFAHPTAEEHDKELMKVLFSETETYLKNSDTTKYIKELKYASYLTVDQFGDSGEAKYNALKNWKVKGIPSKFSDIKYKYTIPDGSKQVDANTHRRFTHQGWIIDFGNSKANAFWDTRKKVMLGTVNTIFGFNKLPVVIKYDENCVDFCGIIYYVHLLGDYLEADSYKKIRQFMVPLAGSNDGVDMISNLREYIGVVFADQEQSSDYKDLMKSLDKIEKPAKKVQQSSGGLNNDEEFDVIHTCAEELLDLLIKYVPNLLKNEEFFRSVFYPDITR